MALDLIHGAFERLSIMVKITLVKYLKATLSVTVILLVLSMTALFMNQQSEGEFRPRIPIVNSRCIMKLKDMQDLINKIGSASRYQKDKVCSEAWGSVSRIFDIHISDDKHISIPIEMRDLVMGWINGWYQRRMAY